MEGGKFIVFFGAIALTYAPIPWPKLFPSMDARLLDQRTFDPIVLIPVVLNALFVAGLAWLLPKYIGGYTWLVLVILMLWPVVWFIYNI